MPSFASRRSPWAVALLSACAFSAASPSPAGEPSVSIDFPGGSGVVEKWDGATRTIRLSPTPHEGRGWTCWWYVKVSGLKVGETLALDVGDAPWATPDRAAVSVDDKTWKQTEPGRRDGKRIVYSIPISADVMWLAWGPPFTPAAAAELTAWAAEKCDDAQAFELCRSEGDRAVPALRVKGPGDDAQRSHLWVQARQHAWESGSSWVCQGFVEWLVSDDPTAAAFRKKTHVVVVPIMDVDNVFLGAGGKEAKPQDHNRDWSEKPHWNSVAAAQKEILKLNETGRFDAFIDLHNPGATSKHPYFYIAPRDSLTELGKQNLEAFLEANRQEMKGPLSFIGEVKESGAGYSTAWQAISKNWVTRSTRDHAVSVTLETAWNTPHSTQDGYRQVGRELGLSLSRFLPSIQRRAAP